MSKIGKLPIEVPNGAKVAINGDVVNVEGPKGKLSYTLVRGITVTQDGTALVVEKHKNDKQTRAHFGTARALINNMVLGVTNGWRKELELNGVGFTAKLAGDKLTLATGYSHTVDVIIPKEVSCNVNRNQISLESADKELVGLIAAKIRKVCPPEPYLGKGIKYADEHVRRKAGKAGK